jgi:hypothetical protein
MRAYERLTDENGRIETTDAFEAWQTYRDWGPDRSYQKVARWLSKSETIIKRWASRWEWQERLQAMDDWQEMIKRDAVEENERQKAQDFISRQQKLDEEILSLKEALMPRLKQMASFPLVRTTKETKDNGKTEITHVHPARWSFNTLVNALAVLTKETQDAGELQNVETAMDRTLEEFRKRKARWNATAENPDLP